MTVGAALQSAAIRLIGRRPAVFFGASETFEMEMCDLANEVAIDIAKYQDWQALVRVYDIVADGVQTEFPLPADYDRMLARRGVQDLQSWAWGYHRYDDIAEFLHVRERGFSPLPGGWVISGDTLMFAPEPSSGSSAALPYITKAWVKGGASEFTSDADEFLLPERLLTLGLVWRWRENKKLDATGDQEAFIKALDEYAAKDGGTRIQRSSARVSFPNTYPAWPWLLGG